MLHLSGGGCRLCEVCAKQENKPCRCAGHRLHVAYGPMSMRRLLAAGLKYVNGANTLHTLVSFL